MAHVNADAEPHKRKRIEAEENGTHSDRILQPPPLPQLGNSTPINYFSRANAEKLRLIQGDGETFSEILALIADYEEGVLSRHESLAVNLGAKLTGPRLLKMMEGAFEGPITTSPPQSQISNPISWLDIVNFAKANPEEFALTTLPSGARVCQFTFGAVQVEIVEDDWRLIASGSLDRLIPSDPLDEDEAAEVATLEILDKRLQSLIQKADEVAARARQLNYHLGGRRAAINARRLSQSPAAPSFQAVNQPHRASSASAGIGYDLHSDLIQQFTAPTVASSSRRSADYSTTPTGTPIPLNTVVRGVTRGATPGSRPFWPQSTPVMPRESSTSEDPSSIHRPLITAMVEKLGKGEPINPPCDRCRRLRAQCVKHLTACQGCTKKHAKCTWKTATDDELAYLKKDMAVALLDEADGDDADGDGRSQSHSAGRHLSHDELRGIDDAGSGVPGQDDRSRPGSRGEQVPRQPAPDGDEEDTSRMEVDPVASEQSEAGRRTLPTGLPRDPNLLGLATAAAQARDQALNTFRP